MRMSVKGPLALLVGVFVVALLGVALVQWRRRRRRARPHPYGRPQDPRGS
jgi:uncharacterized iron-regulated membrane protein